MRLLVKLGGIMSLMLMESFIWSMPATKKGSKKAETNYKVYYKCHNWKKFLLWFWVTKLTKLELYHSTNSAIVWG